MTPNAWDPAELDRLEAAAELPIPPARRERTPRRLPREEPNPTRKGGWLAAHAKFTRHQPGPRGLVHGDRLHGHDRGALPTLTRRRDTRPFHPQRPHRLAHPSTGPNDFRHRRDRALP